MEDPLRPGFRDSARREPQSSRALFWTVAPLVVVALVVLGLAVL